MPVYRGGDGTFGTTAETLEDRLASTDLNQGASLVGINDAANKYTASHVEGALQELGSLAKQDADSVTVGSLLATSINTGGLAYHDTATGANFDISNATTGIGNGLAIGASSINEAYLWFYQNGPLDIATNSVSRIYIAGAGDVGIGNRSPATKLDVTGAITCTTLNTGQGANELYAMDQNVTAASNVNFNNMTVNGAFTSLGIDDNASATALTIDANRNLGFGTSDIESWQSGYVGIHYGSQAFMMANKTAGNAWFGVNFYFDGTWKYRATAPAADFSANSNGELMFVTAPSGTADTAATRTIVGRFYNDGGFVVGAPAGLSKSAGTINAQAVYDDNVLLTCYVLDAAVDGKVDETKWDAKVPDRIIEQEDKESIIEERKHVPMRKFKARLGGEYDPLDIDKYSQHWKDKKHLTSMPNEEKFDPEEGMATGRWIQRLIETVEIQAVHIDNLNKRLKDVESKLST